MPELPEVQTVVSQLGKKITGKTLVGFSTEWAKNVKPGIMRLQKDIVGAKILGTRRIGKHIIIDLDNGSSIVIHLKMSGHLLYKDKANETSTAWSDPMNQFIRHQFFFTDGSRVDFSDLRKFGWIDCVPTIEVGELKALKSLGCDALSGECDREYLFELLKKQTKTKKIATLLLEQDKIAGIGNIYRSEMLFRAGIRPERQVVRITKEETEKLFVSMKEVLKEAVRLRGTTDGDFRDVEGKPGGFQKTLFVYAREGEVCKRCGTIIVRKKLGQRSVFFCPTCQK